MDQLTLPPRRATRNRAALLLALLLVAAAVLTGCGKKNPRPDASEINAYVALGDSYTAVSGDGPFLDQGCLRTDDDYPALVAQRLHVADFKNVSCGGANSDDMTSAQVRTGVGVVNQPQFDALSKDTKLVTLGLGLNNTNLFYYLAYACVPVKGQITPGCTAYLKWPDSRIDNALRAMGQDLKKNLNAIRTRAPNAQIVLIGYPRMLPDSGECAAQLPLPQPALDRIRAALKTTEETMLRSALQARADFVDMYKASEGHDVCSADPWVNGQANLAGKALAFHPYKAYHVAVADKIMSLIAKG